MQMKRSPQLPSSPPGDARGTGVANGRMFVGVTGFEWAMVVAVPVMIYLAVRSIDNVLRQGKSGDELDMTVTILIGALGFAAIGITLLAARNRYLVHRLAEHDGTIAQHADQHQFLTSIFDSTSDQIAVIDAEGTVIAANRLWTDSIQDESTRLIRTSVGGNFLAACRAGGLESDSHAIQIFDNVRRVGRGKLQQASVECPSISDEGVSWYRCVISAMANAPTRCVLIAYSPINQYRRVLDDLRLSEERFRTLCEHAPVGIFMTDAEGRCRYVNEGWCVMTDQTPENANGSNWIDAIHPDDRETVTDQWTILTGSSGNGDMDWGSSINCHWRVVGLNKRVTHVYGAAAAMRNQDDELTGFIGILTDITKRVEVEEAFDSFFNSSPDILTIANNASYFRTVNPAFEQILGVSAEELTAAPFTDRIHPDDLQETKQQIESVSAGGATANFECRMQDSKGQWHWLEWSWAASTTVDHTFYGIARDITETRQARETMAELSMALENSTTGVARLDRAGRFAMVHPSYARITGYDSREMVGMAWEPTVHPDDREGAFEAYNQMLETGRSEVEVRGIRKNGVNFFAHLVLVRYTRDDEYAGHYCFVRDVTKFKIAEDERVIAQNRYESLYQYSPIAIVIIHPQTLRVIECNFAAEQLLESSCDDLKHRNFPDIAVSDDVDTLREQLGQVSNADETTFQVNIQTEAGNTKHVCVSVLLVDLLRETVLSVILQDTTELENATEALRESEQAIRIIADAMPACISYADNEWRYQFNNATYESWFGIPRSQMSGEYIQDIVGEDVFEGIKHYLMRAYSGERVSYETQIPRIEGGLRDVEVTHTPQFDANGNVTGIYNFVHDISGRVESEHESSRMQSDMAHLARLGTIGELASGIAHEINQPLGAIRIYLQLGNEMIQNQPDAPTDLISVIEDAILEVERASNIIANLREFVRKRKPNMRSTVRISDVITDSISIMGHQLRDGEIHVQLNLPYDLPMIVLDPIQIQQVLVNLLNNAVHAMSGYESNDKTITISAAYHDADGEIRVEVEDNGPGVPEDMIGRVFEPFLTTKASGMGLGLSLSRTMINAHGGDLKFQPVEPHGARFRFNIPLYAGDPANAGD